MSTGLLQAFKGTIDKKGLTATETDGDTLVVGVSGSQRSLLTATLFADDRQPYVILTSNYRQARQWKKDLSTLLGPEVVHIFQPLETLPHEEVLTDPVARQSRLRALDTLYRGERNIVIVPLQAASEKLMPAEAFTALKTEVATGDVIEVDGFSELMIQLGYNRVEKVMVPGEFAIRGGIIDCFPPVLDRPVRLDLFDTVVDSIREFDPETQRSEDELDSILIGPARQFFISDAYLADGMDKIMKAGKVQAERLEKQELNDTATALVERIDSHIEKLRENIYFEGIEQYLPFFYPRPDTILDYLPSGTIVFDDPVRLQETYNGIMKDITETQASLIEKGRILPEQALLNATWDELFSAGHQNSGQNGSRLNALGPKRLFLAAFDQRIDGMNPSRVFQLTVRTPEPFHGRFQRLAGSLRQWRKDRFRVCLLVSTPERGQRIVDVFKDEGLEAVQVSHLNGELKPGSIVVTTGSLETGIEFPSARLLVLTDQEIFGRTKKATRTKPEVDEATRISHFGDLKEGDYVVHTNHGIGRYIGVETLEIAGVHKDYLVVKYAGEDKLYVPTDQVDLLQRYYGAESTAPKLSKLGGNEWARVKKRVKQSVQEMAKELLQLYAERETVEGHAFAKDTVWQSEFEDAFPFEETYDQMRAINEVKKDMERSRPMDRLLCGDVGYGKTEVAIRASFKAVMDGKQVAFLVPTTILAQQHGRTYEERFAGYPVKVRVLSRFQSAAEQAEIMRGVKDGSVDIVIGTHRLLSKDLVFKDLGLVVVDEEQRFGVAQKERLKEMRKNVDVLTLTATPIPRTLHMSMVGVRDMSIIETPPEDRLPIRTYVVEYDEELIREAIMREIGRGGQVYFVYNQVRKIDSFVASLKQLLPEVRFAVAHGQMDEDRLERVMLDFLNGEYDVLVCSTIIETGMDISNVNTLIVYDADRLGLAQLYQLRGRVGRSNRVAYSYFTYRKDKVLAEDAEKRLQAIKDFTELGSGFKIAMRDLEIRGAGNLLGPEQHGFIASVGFELYCRLLEESIKELQGAAVVNPPDPVIDLNVDAYISDEYISDSRQKVEVYKKIVGINDLETAADLQDEIRDRFGDIPDAVLNLLTIARIKVLGRRVGMGSITSKKEDMIIKMLTGIVLPKEVAELTRKYRGRVIVMPRTSSIHVKGRGLSESDHLALAEMVVSDLDSYL